MKNGKTLRVVLDVAMSVMIVLEMFMQLTGEFLHEVIGFAFFATIVAHIALSAAWMKKTARNAKAGKLTKRRTALAVIGCLLAVTTLVLGVSSVAISGILSSAGFAWPFGAYSTWAIIHTVSAYALCALVVVHLAMHWAFLASTFKVPYDPTRRRAIGTAVHAAAAVGVVALGVTVAGKTLPQIANAHSEEGAAGLGGNSGGGTGTGSGGYGSAIAGDTAKHGKSKKGHSGAYAYGNGSGGKKMSANGDSSTGGNASSGGNATGTGESSSDGSSQGSGNTNTSGICTLCRKQCPLTSPKCNKPYDAGLI